MKTSEIDFGDIIEWEMTGVCPVYGINEVISVFGGKGIREESQFIPLSYLNILYVLKRKDFNKNKKKVI